VVAEAGFGDGQTTYAGFWWRVLAWLLDTIIATTMVVVIGFIVGFVLATSYPDLARDTATLSLIGQIIGIVGTVLYFTCFEASALRATPGKMLCAIKVVDERGERISFGRSLGRYLGKIISALILGIGFMMAGWTRQKQALHDIMTGCLVIRVPRTVQRIALPAGARM